MVRADHRSRGARLPSTSTSFGVIRELRHGLRHRPQRGAENVVAVDAIDVGDADADDRDFHDALVEIGSRILVEHLAVVDVGGDASGSRITAAATTGPANGPRPASSTPAIGLEPS